ncbi:DUF1700 domain-containing protein [Romboutsia sp.]|uniref:DUF1700 domain-containing protein n=1 Tax=Romboutsia sp. TaxID=1965302 RepID=UPI003F3ED0C3
MRKDDFLEILKDYLKKSFSEDEIMDILRDYEEYFIDGAIEGKTEIEIISGLGSPKEIASELLAENNANNENKIKSKVENLYITFKSKCKSVLNKFKVNLNDKNHVKSRKKISFIQILLTLILLPFAFGIGMSTIGFGVGLVGSIFAAIVGTPFAISLISVMPEVKMVVVFGSIAYIGLEILLWQLFIAIFKLEKRAVKIYLTWIKTNQLYINGSIKKEEMEQDGGLLDE